jgi:ribonuclease HI
MSDDNVLALPLCAMCGGVAARCRCPNIELGVHVGGMWHGYAAHVCAPGAPIDVYADGSGTTDDNPCGAGIVAQRADFIIWEAAIALGNGTNNNAEAAAIRLALETLSREYSDKVHACIYSDSQWALTACSVDCNWKLKPGEAVSHALRARALLQKMPRVSLHKIKGHAGVRGNERADELANIARRRQIQATNGG